MPTANDRLFDESIAHQVDLTKYSNGTVRRLIALLNRIDADLSIQLQTKLEGLDASNFSIQRLEDLLISIRILNRQAYQDIQRELTDELRGLVGVEVKFQTDLFRDVLPIQVSVAQVSEEQIYAAAMSRPFQGRLLREWTEGIEADRMTRIRDTLRMGYAEGKTTSQLVREIRGTKAAGYADGIIEIDRRHAESVVRTAISHTAAFARDQVYAANDDVIKAVVWRSTLDSRTSPMCRVRDGLKYTLETHKPIGHSIPWLGGPGRIHWCCRSTSAPVLKSWKELGGVGEEFTPAQRASMDGAVPAETTYGQWLARQSAARQDDVLGPTRGRLLRSGALKIDQFSNDKGQLLTLVQLREKHAEAFRKAA